MLARSWLALAAGALAAAPATADYLVFLGGGIQETRGPWAAGARDVLYYSSTGTLLSIPAADVDLPASAFITWQVGGRRRAPAPSRLPDAEGAAPGGAAAEAAPACLPARLVAFAGAETLEVAIDGRAETVHLACLDAPESEHEFLSLGWFGRVAEGVAESLVRPGQEICLFEESPPQRDGAGHRVVFVRLPDGRDPAAELIGAGFGLARAGQCARADAYLGLEGQARREERGHWGRSSQRAAFAAAGDAMAAAAGPPVRTARSGVG